MLPFVKQLLFYLLKQRLSGNYNLNLSVGQRLIIMGGNESE
nr:MAG TPA: hypothetical protein [Caudoviricetes sp.]